MINDYKWKLKLWTNLVLCKFDARNKEEFLKSKDNKIELKKTKKE
jgi:hypothetical protein